MLVFKTFLSCYNVLLDGQWSSVRASEEVKEANVEWKGIQRFLTLSINEIRIILMKNVDLPLLKVGLNF